MPTIDVSDEMYRRVTEFSAIVRAVLNEDVDTVTSFGIVLERGLKTALGDVVAHQDESVFLESFHQMAARHPDVVYPYVADMVSLGADLRQALRAEIGFRKPTKPKS